MKEGLALSIIAIVLVGVVAANIWCWIVRPPGSSILREVPLSKPYVNETGFAYIGSLSLDIPSDMTKPLASMAEIYEDGNPLGPPHTMHDTIRRDGNGRFSHWGERIYFSTSDNSDPNFNGRRYTVRYWSTMSPLTYFVLIGVNYGFAIFILDRFIARLKGKEKMKRVLRVGVILLATSALLQVTFWVLTEDVLAKEGKNVRELYAYTFQGKPTEFSPGAAQNYVKHHYLNYALNPAVPYGQGKQFNSTYRIRRTEPIRPRQEVKWRALALGGSTTFGDLVRREEDTWVSQLELRIREQCGDDCDVINGGVGGYTVLENFIHYVTLLEDLAPDVVILYEGINDVDARLFGSVALDYSNYRIPWRSEESVFPQTIGAFAWAFPYRYYILVDRLVKSRHMHIGEVVSPPHPPPSEWAGALDRNPPTIYRTHLKNLIQLLLSHGQAVVVLPQYFTVTQEGDEFFMKGVEEHNRINRALADEMKVPFFGKLIDTGLFHREDTFDNCHFNEQGSIKMAEEVFNFLRNHGLVPEKVKFHSHIQRSVNDFLYEKV
jgi:lysophospholipase L1-like esterase